MQMAHGAPILCMLAALLPVSALVYHRRTPPPGWAKGDAADPDDKVAFTVVLQQRNLEVHKCKPHVSLLQCNQADIRCTPCCVAHRS